MKIQIPSGACFKVGCLCQESLLCSDMHQRTSGPPLLPCFLLQSFLAFCLEIIQKACNVTATNLYHIQFENDLQAPILAIHPYKNAFSLLIIFKQPFTFFIYHIK